MAEPDNPMHFVCLEASDLTVFVSTEIWDCLKPGQPKLLVAVTGYGRFWLYLEPSPLASSGGE